MTQPAFGKILCGVDDSRPSAEAAQQAIALATPGGSLDLVAVSWNVGTGPRTVSALNMGRAEEALEEARREAAAAGLFATRRVMQARDPAKALFVEAWSLGLKAVSVFRQGSKIVQPLSSPHVITLAAPEHETEKALEVLPD